MEAQSLEQKAQTQLPISSVIPYDRLTTQQAVEGRMAIAAVVGAERATDFSLVRRLAVFQAEFYLGVERPLRQMPPADRDNPDKLFPELLVTFTDHYPVAQAIEILDGPNNPEKEIERRRQLEIERKQRHVTGLANAVISATVRDAAEAARKARLKELRSDDWARLSAWQKSIYRLASVFNVRDPGLAHEIRNIARAGNGHILGGPGSAEAGPDLPDQVWWE